MNTENPQSSSPTELPVGQQFKVNPPDKTEGFSKESDQPKRKVLKIWTLEIYSKKFNQVTLQTYILFNTLLLNVSRLPMIARQLRKVYNMKRLKQKGVRKHHAGDESFNTAY